MTQPLAIDLFCGLGGWTEGLLAESYQVVGFDVERHVYGEARYPAQLVLQDVLTIHGRQFKDAALIVASPPCQAYSYRAMPWKRAKALPPPDNSLFEACFRIQREANEAVRHHCQTCGVFLLSHHEWTKLGACSKFVPGSRFIPLVVENVRGAQPWVGRARWHFGSFYLWGDVPALMPLTRKHVKVPTMGAGWYPPGHPKHVAGLSFNGHAARELKGRRTDVGKGARFTSRDCGDERKNGGDWFGSGADCSLQRRAGSKSPARKAAAAHIAKIPTVLARHIARAWHPRLEQSA